jgi:hypothetical protein
MHNKCRDCLKNTWTYDVFEIRTSLPTIQWVPGALSSRVKRPEREADHSPTFSAEVENASITPLPQYAFMAWCSINRTQGHIYLYLHLFTDSIKEHLIISDMLQNSDTLKMTLFLIFALRPLWSHCVKRQTGPLGIFWHGARALAAVWNLIQLSLLAVYMSIEVVIQGEEILWNFLNCEVRVI